MAKTAAKDRRSKSRSQLTKTDKQVIKQEQAAFIAKIESAQPNEHQAAIYAAAQSGKGHYVVLAGPGSGKTFTSIKMSTCFSGKSIYFSYNRKIMLDTNDKLVAIDSPMVATTSHAFGLLCLRGYLGWAECRVDDEDSGKKYQAIVDQYIADHWDLFVKSIQADLESDDEGNVAVMKVDAKAWISTLIHYTMVSLTDPTPEGLAALVDDFDLEDISLTSLTWSFVCAAVPAAIEEGIKQFLGPEHRIAFDDMIYLPNVVEGVSIRKYDQVIVDEAQDTSRASLELMLNACHASSQIFFVGDPRQSVYAFAGADFDSINRIIARLNPQLLPLKIVYRCGSAIVEIANQLCAEDEKLMSAGLHTGKVEVVAASDYIERLVPGQSAVIGRTTRRLVQGCLKVLQTGKRAKVLGKNLGVNIAAVVTRIEAVSMKQGRQRLPVLASDLSNLIELLNDYEKAETKILKESRQNPEMAIAELEDKVETVRAFFTAYVAKCGDPRLRVPDDPQCAFNKTAKDFKAYIRGLFSDDDNAKDFILFMTAHRSKGGEWDDVYLIGCDEFPHPRAKSDRQKQQEQNLMYVAVTRAIENLCFVDAPFQGITVPGYEPPEELAVPNQQQEIQPTPAVAIREGSIYDAPGFEDYDPDVAETLFRDTFGLYPSSLHHDEIDPVTIIDATPEPEPLEPGTFSRVLAVEVLCPTCNSACVDPATGSLSITYDLVGHTVVCSACKKACIVPLNAFRLQGDVIAREKPTPGVTNAKREKKGRTQKERKAKSGRKTKGKGVRQPLQLSLDIRTIQTLNAMGINKSELFEELLQQYEPFLDVWADLGNEEDEASKLDHDEIEDEE